jgi:hypothetical protein
MPIKFSGSAADSVIVSPLEGRFRYAQMEPTANGFSKNSSAEAISWRHGRRAAMTSAIFPLALLLFVLLISALAFVPVLRDAPAEAIRAFIAFFFLLLGLRFMLGPAGGEENVFLGDLFASLALTFFWVMWRK